MPKCSHSSDATSTAHPRPQLGAPTHADSDRMSKGSASDRTPSARPVTGPLVGVCAVLAVAIVVPLAARGVLSVQAALASALDAVAAMWLVGGLLIAGLVLVLVGLLRTVWTAPDLADVAQGPTAHRPDTRTVGGRANKGGA